MITTASLQSYSTKDLAQLAKKKGVAGWHSMRKDQLIKVLGKSSAPAKAKSGPPRNSKPISSKPAPAKSIPGKSKVKPKPAAKAVARSGPRPTTKPAMPIAAKITPIKSHAPLKPQARSGATKTVAAKKSMAAKVKETAELHRLPGDIKSPSKPLENKSLINGHAAKLAPKKSNTSPTVIKKIRKIQEDQERRKDLAGPVRLPSAGDENSTPRVDVTKDRIVLLVRDPYWLHCFWELTRQSIQRVQAAMAEYWHGAQPMLRLMEVESNGTTSTAERVVREIPIHGGVHNWYIDVQSPPRSFRVELGYSATNGRFFSVCRSNAVTTPRPGSADAIDENWADVAENYERIFAQSGGYNEENNSTELQELFEERLKRPMGSPASTRFGVGADSILNRKRDFKFEVDAEMIVFGNTKPDAHVMLGGEPVKLRPDGSFTVRLSMPDRRQVIPIVACSKDGVEQRTVVLAVERNTKIMEPMLRESSSSSSANQE